ncbi:amidase [Mesorhizobium sp. M1136]|uniref:amidase n=1 Tax=Mesorhizobium sp. M1136 TaxID=2957059 RepID=UPI003339A55D
MNRVRKVSGTVGTLTALDCLELYRAGTISPVEVVRDCLERIDAINPELNAFCYIAAEAALIAARQSEARWNKGQPIGVLDGVPATIKDLTLTRGMPTRRGSAATSAAGPWNEDAPLTARMREAGSIILGKTTTPEYGWKGATDSPLTGITRNPWDPTLTPGGSSGGAAVAAALNLGFLHQGSDGGGSIRIPASFTGTFGFKPTFGYVPQWPLSAMGVLSHIGPMTRTVDDAVLMMDVITRPDARDGFGGIAYKAELPGGAESLEGLRIAYSRTLGYADVAPDILRVTDEAVEQLRSLGAEVIEIDPGFTNPVEIFATFWFAGAARLITNMSEAQKGLLDPGFLECAIWGEEISLAEFKDAEQARFDLSAKMAAFHESFDFLVTPTVAISPFPVGKDKPDGFSGWVDWTPFTFPFNLTQQPAASLPSGLDDAGLPVGLQLVGPRYHDANVLSAARVIERRLGRLAPPSR